MKVNWENSAHPERAQILSLMVSPRSNAPGIWGNSNITRFKVNWKTKSTIFRALDNIIRMIDFTFDSLTPGIKVTWDSAAAAHPLARACGCKHTPLDGKKLHQAFNLMPVQGGAPVNSTLPAGAWTGGLLVSTIGHYDSPPYPQDQIQIISDPDPAGYTINFAPSSTGPALALPIPPSQAVTNLFTGDFGFAYLFSLAKNSSVSYCTTNANGLPSGSGTVDIL